MSANNIGIKHNFYALRSTGPRGRRWNSSLKGEGFNTSQGAQQMLMFLVPIIAQTDMWPANILKTPLSGQRLMSSWHHEITFPTLHAFKIVYSVILRVIPANSNIGGCFFFRAVYEPRHEKTCFMPYANNKGTDQPAHPCSLISTFVVHCLDSLIHILAKSKIPRL